MPQANELNALGFSPLARKNLVIAIISAMGIVIVWQARAMETKNDQIVQCKDAYAPMVERLMTRAEQNGLKADNVWARQELLLGNQRIIIETQSRIQATLNKIEERKR